MHLYVYQFSVIFFYFYTYNRIIALKRNRIYTIFMFRYLIKKIKFAIIIIIKYNIYFWVVFGVRELCLRILNAFF